MARPTHCADCGLDLHSTTQDEFCGDTCRFAAKALPKAEPRTIDATPTWEGLLSYLLLGIERGDAKGRRIAREELRRMAQAADSWNAHCKAQKGAQ